MRDPETVQRALDGVDAVYHFAAMVGVGQSMYQVADYTGVNGVGTAVLLEALIEQPVERLVVASSMSIYGEGLYCAPGRLGRPRRSSDRSSSCARATGRCATRPARSLTPVPTPESKPPSLESIYALSKFDQERMCLLIGDGLRHPDGRAALLQRLRDAAGAVEPVHRRARDLRVAVPERPAAGDLRGRAPAARLRERATTWRAPAGSRSSAPTPPAGAFNVGLGRAPHDPRGGDAHGRGARARRTSSPEITAQYRVGDIRHCFADITLARERARLRAAGDARRRARRARRAGSSGQQADDRVGDGAAGARSARAHGMTRSARDARTHGGRRGDGPGADHRRRRLHRHEPRAPAALGRPPRASSSTTCRARASSGTCAGCCEHHGDSRATSRSATSATRAPVRRAVAGRRRRCSISPRRSR